MLPVLQLGPMAIPVPGLVLLAGLWLGMALSERYAQRFGAQPSQVYNLAFAALIGGLIGARVAYVLRYPEIFAQNPGSIISINPGLLDSWGAVAGALLAGLIYGQRKKMRLWQTLDALTPALAVLILAIAISHLASGAAYGRPTNLPWGIELWGARRHPAQVYEILAAGIILTVTWPGRWPVEPARPGAYLLSFITLAAGAALFIDAFRGDSRVAFSGIRQSQLTAWLLLAASLYGLYRLRFPKSQRKELQS